MKLTKNAEVFELEFIQPLVEKWILVLDEQFQRDKELLLDQNCNLLKAAMVKLAEKQCACCAQPLQYLHFSWLRNPFLYEQKLCYDVLAYGEAWFEDPNELEVQFESPFLLVELLGFQEEIGQVITKQRKFELKNLESYFVAKYFELFQSYAVALLQMNFQQHVVELLEKLDVTSSFYLLGGEYKGVNDFLYHREQPKVFKELLLEDTEQIFAEEMTVDSYDLSQQDFSEQTILETSAVKTNFSGSCFHKAVLQNSHFTSADCCQCDFSESVLIDTSFMKADCTGADFSNIRGGLHPATDLLPSYFGLNFREAKLDQVNFIGAELKGADFTGAKMHGAKFLSSMQEQLELTPQQINEIEWVRP